MRQNFRVNGVGKNKRMSLVQVRVKHQQLPESLDGSPFFFPFSSDEGRIRLKKSLVPCVQMDERLRVGRSCIKVVPFAGDGMKMLRKRCARDRYGYWAG